MTKEKVEEHKVRDFIIGFVGFPACSLGVWFALTLLLRIIFDSGSKLVNLISMPVTFILIVISLIYFFIKKKSLISIGGLISLGIIGVSAFIWLIMNLRLPM